MTKQNAKTSYLERVLKHHKIDVSFDGQPGRQRVPSPIKNEVFSAWKNRVLGENTGNIKVHLMLVPPANTKVADIVRLSTVGTKLLKIEKQFREKKVTISDLKNENQKLVEELKRAQAQTAPKPPPNLPRKLLTRVVSLVDGDCNELPPSAKDHLEKYLESAGERIKVDDVLEFLVRSYSEAVKQFRQLDRSRQSDL
jgi:hypothetical protein